MSASLLDIDFPDRVYAHTSSGEFELDWAAHGGGFGGHGVSGRVHSPGDCRIAVELEESADPIFRIELQWDLDSKPHAVLGDAWERAYGDLRWQPTGDNPLASPWHFAAASDGTFALIGVKTGPPAMACWHVSKSSLRLTLDVRSGNRPLRLGTRSLRLASVIVEQRPSARWSLQDALKRLCDHPRLTREPVYGINDWYYAYGNNTAERILDDSTRAGQLCHDLHNRPFSVIDDGWSATEGTWSRGNARFPDMPRLATNITDSGCRPGIWVRPLLCDEKLPEAWFMAENTLDPSRPEVLQHVHDLIYRAHAWGYELIKHDYTTFDVCALWGFQMKDGVAGSHRTFADDTRTTAEILRELYRTIKAAAGSSLVLGCNTVGHLAAGLEELQRIGDDTSGREWARTVKMGVNSLAYRGAQHGAFFEADPDCVAITTEVAWEHNKLWLDLASRSGTVLFVSAQADAVGPAQVNALKAAFKAAATRRPLAAPTDKQSPQLAPTEWIVDRKHTSYDWT